MRVLLTNDDGIEAPGLLALAHALRDAGHDLVVAAPAGDSSGSGTSLGAIDHGTIVACEPHALPGLDGVPAHRVSAPPAFAVLAACFGALGPPPDVVVAGINDGHNTGRSVLHSSTVGAALTASTAGRSALAVSCGDRPGARFDTAAAVGVAVLGWLVAHAPKRTVLNVNVPDVDLADLRGVRWARLGRVGSSGLMIKPAADGLRLERFPTAQDVLARDEHADTDAALVAARCVSVTGLLGGPREVSDLGSLEGVLPVG
ncbi:5'/3'-nucleotidase SurE [Amycolatopsis sp. NPDC049253]|uniref:5'/3'-nucleotidase SurE n=1 Tax=Amycolatopsis sp. NPDC049253 TaxID=3155274 RepID=UPI003438E24B